VDLTDVFGAGTKREDRGKLAVDDIVVSNSATERLAKVAARR